MRNQPQKGLGLSTADGQWISLGCLPQAPKTLDGSPKALNPYVLHYVVTCLQKV